MPEEQSGAGFELLETILFDSGRGEYLLGDQHLNRLLQSAEAFGWQLPGDFRVTLREALSQKRLEAAPLWSSCSQRVRLLVSSEGRIRIEATPFAPYHPHRMILGDPGLEGEPLARIVVETDPAFRCHSANPFLNHKTTKREVYDAARARHRIGQAGGAFDVLLVNERGCVTECTIANIMVEVRDADGTAHWITPALADGLLRGILRAELVTGGFLTERSISLVDFKALVQSGARVRCFNSVRGIYPVAVDI